MFGGLRKFAYLCFNKTNKAMIITKISLSDVLKGVYTAKQCADVSDCEIALSQLHNQQRLYPHYYKSIRKRADAIERKIQELKNKPI